MTRPVRVGAGKEASVARVQLILFSLIPTKQAGGLEFKEQKDLMWVHAHVISHGESRGGVEIRIILGVNGL